MFGKTFRRFRKTRAVALAAGLVVAALPAQARQVFDFKVLLDEREIGFHRFEVNQSDERSTIDSQANFEVTFLAIPFYRYGHSNQEVWRDGCLESIRSRTNDNGDSFSVEGYRDGRGFSVSTQDKAYQLDGSCVMTFAYWNTDMLEQQALLNSQTGEYLPIEIDYTGTEALQVGEGTVPTHRYRLRNTDHDIDITVWYEQGTQRWMSLESRVGGDRVIRYVPAAAGSPAAGSPAAGSPAAAPAPGRAINAAR